MLTPQFELEQFDDYLLITLKAPYIKTNDVEIYMEDNEFKFYVKPYFLRLYFPCDVIEDGREKAEYDISTGIFKIQVPKKNVGEHFPNMDMLTTLLETKKQKLFKHIEVIDDDNENDSTKTEGDGKEDQDINCSNDAISDAGGSGDDDLCWEVEQELFTPPDLLTGYKYGFANKVTGVFSRLQGELYEVIDLTDPDNTPPVVRREQRVNEENAQFDPDHYIADFMDDEFIQGLINYKAPWDIEYDRILTAYKSCYPETSDLITPKGNPILFTEEEQFIFKEEEKNALLQLPNKDYLLNKVEEQTVFLSLVDVIFAYAYNHRTTEGENTSESPWTISKISATISWMDSFKSLHDVISSGARRCLCYPLYRHWILVQKILKDVKIIFLLGRRWILRCLLEVHSILQGDENKYIFNDLYITDLCVWIQKEKRKKILSIATKLQCSQITKSDTNFDLGDIERRVVYEKECIGESSSEEEDNSDSSQDNSTDSSANDSVSIDSDDDEDDGNTIDIGLSTQTVVSPRIEVIHSTEVECSEVEIIRTGVEELLTVQTKFVGDQIGNL